MNRLDSFWAESLGCEKRDLKFKESKIVVRTKETDYNDDRTKAEIDIFQRKDNRIISCSREVEDRLRRHELDLLKTDIKQKKLEEIGLEVEKLLGPAFLSYTTQGKFSKYKSRNCRELKQEDSKALKKLKQESDEEEIENSINDTNVGSFPVFGRFVNGELVAVSSYKVWNSNIGFPDVFVKQKFRGNGYGKQVVSKSTERILENELIPVYRTLEKWSSSVGLAKSLGYQKYATTYLLELKK